MFTPSRLLSSPGPTTSSRPSNPGNSSTDQVESSLMFLNKRGGRYAVRGGGGARCPGSLCTRTGRFTRPAASPRPPTPSTLSPSSSSRAAEGAFNIRLFMSVSLLVELELSLSGSSVGLPPVGRFPVCALGAEATVGPERGTLSIHSPPSSPSSIVAFLRVESMVDP